MLPLPLRRRLRRLAGIPEDLDFATSYWELRYAAGGTSGTGSYGELATFKAEVLNRFVAEHRVTSVVELGCGDGNQLALADYPSYVGLDVAPSALDRCIAAFADDASKSFYLYDPERFADRRHAFRCDLALSLDVLFHLVEDQVFDRYLDLLFDCGGRFVGVYSSNAALPDPEPHVRHREFTSLVARRHPQWRLVEHVPNPHRGTLEGAVSDFWFWARD
ncbi:MAG: hypothetical protein ACXVGH_00020 [Mycobacteriales bacterium]